MGGARARAGREREREREQWKEEEEQEEEQAEEHEEEHEEQQEEREEQLEEAVEPKPRKVAVTEEEDDEAGGGGVGAPRDGVEPGVEKRERATHMPPPGDAPPHPPSYMDVMEMLKKGETPPGGHRR